MFLYCAGFLPVLIPMFRIKTYEEKERKYILFMLVSAIFTIVEVALIVFIPEERAKLYPAKFCYRYLAPVFMPLLIMLLKCKKEECFLNKKAIAILGGAFVYLIWYYIGGKDWVTVIDAPMLFAIQMQNSRAELKGLTICMVVLLFIISAIAVILKKTNQLKDIRSVFIPFIIVIGLFVFPSQCLWHLELSNYATSGKLLKADFVTVSNSIKRDYDKVYIIQEDDEISKCLRSFFGYSMSDFEVIHEEDGDKEINIENKKTAVIVTSEFKGSLEGVTKKDIETTHIFVYENKKQEKILKIDFK